MAKKITIIQGHPDGAGGHFGHALADACAGGALAAGHEVRRIDVAQLDFPLLRNAARWTEEPPPGALRESQAAIAWADHVVLFYPLWLGTMPALLKGFLEQVLRPGFALVYEQRRFPVRALAGRSGRLVVTMGMPAFWYRCYFRTRSGRGLERNLLGFCGLKPVRETLIGLAEASDDAARTKWLGAVAKLGRSAS